MIMHGSWTQAQLLHKLNEEDNDEHGDNRIGRRHLSARVKRSKQAAEYGQAKEHYTQEKVVHPFLASAKHHRASFQFHFGPATVDREQYYPNLAA